MHFRHLFYKLFNTLRGFLILLLISLILGVGYSIFSLRQINVEAREFINTTMLGLFVDWNNREFLVCTSDELQQNMTTEQLSQINGVFVHLGELLNYHGAKGGLFHTTAWWRMTPRYKVLASFQGGQFLAVITLVRQQDNWVIGRFEYQYSFFPNKRHPSSLKWV